MKILIQQQNIHDVQIVSHITRNRLFCSMDKQWLLVRRKPPVFQSWRHRPRRRTCHDCILMPGISCRCTHRLGVYIRFQPTQHSRQLPSDVHMPYWMWLLYWFLKYVLLIKLIENRKIDVNYLLVFYDICKFVFIIELINLTFKVVDTDGFLRVISASWLSSSPIDIDV